MQKKISSRYLDSQSPGGVINRVLEIESSTDLKGEHIDRLGVVGRSGVVSRLEATVHIQHRACTAAVPRVILGLLLTAVI